MRTKAVLCYVRGHKWMRMYLGKRLASRACTVCGKLEVFMKESP